MRKGLHLAVIGAGSRGRAYSAFALQNPERLVIHAIAEPIKVRRDAFGDRYDIPAERRYATWQDLLEDNCKADAVLIATIDREHVDPAVAFANAGYNILLEKPMAIDSHGCSLIVDAVQRNNILFGVCHVLLYTPHTIAVQEIVGSGRIGEIVSLQRVEPVGFWHFVHSYVRGNWRREDTSSPVLLAKSCHDLDWIISIMGAEVQSISSFGFKNHFRKEFKPEHASDRCVTCQVESNCPYSAARFYTNLFQKGELVWPLDTMIDELSEVALNEALYSGPYGRCVYACDNSVMDNQVVNLAFKGNKTASFSMVAFSDVSDRKTCIFGTRGMLETNGEIIRIYDFLTDSWETMQISCGDATAAEGHSGGDFGLMDAFVSAWETGDWSRIKSNALEARVSHEVVFAAEQARLENTVVHL
ncbi:MAG: oxidoreductase [Spirochaetae bacterium HGW-Spirochaetae-2]|nr:MAG: oxidoreductase [Spirochaetae bacterium HGW-Spirochaetae-2]